MTIDIVPVQGERKRHVQEQFLIRFSLFDTEKERILPDVGPLRFLAFGQSGQSLGQGWAEQVDEGVYEVAIATPRPGRSYLFFACPRSGVGFAELPHLILQTSEKEIAVVRKSAPSSQEAALC